MKGRRKGKEEKKGGRERNIHGFGLSRREMGWGS
jgi:hypothetical protein